MISIIVPVYNVEDFVGACLKSIENQTYKDYEVIIIDDGSTDHSFQICRSYCCKHKNWKLIHQENAGLSAARNTGIKYVAGEYITFLDSDDLLNKDFLFHLFRGICETEAEISTCDFIKINEELNTDLREISFDKPIVITGREATKNLYANGYNDSVKVDVCTWGKLFRKTIFENIKFPEGRINEDEAITYRALYWANNIAILNERLYCYRMRRDSIMHQKFSIKRYDALVALDEAEQYFLNLHDDELYYLVRRMKQITMAQHALEAKKVGCYRYVDKKYRLPFYKIWKLMKEDKDEDKFEYIMYQYYPRLVRLRSIMKRALQIIRRS